MPRLNGSRTTCAPCSAATLAVPSPDASSITTTSIPGSNARSSSTTRPTFSSSFRAGTIASRRRRESRSTTEPAGAAGAVASSATDRHRGASTDELEDPSRAMGVRVLVEDALACATAQLLRRTRIGEQLAIGGERLVGVRDDAQLRPGLEPAVDSLHGIRDDRGAGGGKLERTRRRGRNHGRVRATCDVEVDPRARDRLRKDVEGDVADEARPAEVATEVAAAHGEVQLRVDAARLTDHRLHPVAPELVPVAVEEQVDVLVH